MARALFVPAEDVAKMIAILPHRVVERHYRAAGNAEHHFDILAQQGFAHYLGAGPFRGSGRREAGSGRRDGGSGKREALVGHVPTPVGVGLYRSRVE